MAERHLDTLQLRVPVSAAQRRLRALATEGLKLFKGLQREYEANRRNPGWLRGPEPARLLADVQRAWGHKIKPTFDGIFPTDAEWQQVDTVQDRSRISFDAKTMHLEIEHTLRRMWAIAREIIKIADGLPVSYQTASAPARNVGQPARKRASHAEPTEKGLHVDEAAKLALWNGKRLAINSHADFAVLHSLHSANGAVVPYLELLRAMKPVPISNRTERVKAAPPEVKEAVSHINRALKSVPARCRAKNVRRIGYRLEV